MPHITLRDISPADDELVFKWRNDPWIIKKGSLDREVTWEEHITWFSNIVKTPYSHMYIILIDGEPAGQVRFIGSQDSRVADISIYLLQPYIGQGSGVEAIQLACADVRSKLSIDIVASYILQGNEQSVTAFEKAGFIPFDKCDMKIDEVCAKEGHEVYCLLL